MHPFTLTTAEIEQVSGGAALSKLPYLVSNLMLEGGQMPVCPIAPLPDDRILTTMAIGEEGGLPPPTVTTMALGEEGGLPAY